MDAEDLPGAARAFEAAFAADGNASAALLGGIARYELGDDEAAERLLRAAERIPRTARRRASTSASSPCAKATARGRRRSSRAPPRTPRSRAPRSISPASPGATAA